MPPYAGIDGFLGTRASLMLDVVFLALFVVVPMLGWSIWLVRYRRRYELHKSLQIGLGLVLLVAVSLFEVDIRLHGWRDRAAASPYFSSDGQTSLGETALKIHLLFAVTTPVLWIIVTIQALRKFPNPPQPNQHSAPHKFWARLAALDMLMTAITGWLFYWLAFVE